MQKFISVDAKQQNSENDNHNNKWDTDFGPSAMLDRIGGRQQKFWMIQVLSLFSYICQFWVYECEKRRKTLRPSKYGWITTPRIPYYWPRWLLLPGIVARPPAAENPPMSALRFQKILQNICINNLTGLCCWKEVGHVLNSIAWGGILKNDPK